MTTLTLSEAQIQAQCVRWLGAQARMDRLTFTAIPMGENRDRVTGAKIKRQGGRAGAPDLVIALPNGITVWAEIKSATGRLSPEQRDWQERLLNHGHRHVLVRDVSDLINALREIDPPPVGGASIPHLGRVA